MNLFFYCFPLGQYNQKIKQMERIEIESHDWQFFNMLVKEKVEAGWSVESEVKKATDGDGRVIGYSQILVKF